MISFPLNRISDISTIFLDNKMTTLIYPEPVGKFVILSKREWQVLCLINEGFRVSKIATILSIKPNTVSTIKKNILFKLKIYTNFELYKLSVQEGLVKF